MELFALIGRHDRVDDVVRHVMAERFSRERLDLAVHLDAGRRAHGHEKIRTLGFVQLVQPVLNGIHRASLGIWTSARPLRPAPTCSAPCAWPPAWAPGRVAPARSVTDRGWSCRHSARSEWPNTSAPPCLRESGCGSPRWPP